MAAMKSHRHMTRGKRTMRGMCFFLKKELFVIRCTNSAEGGKKRNEAHVTFGCLHGSLVRIISAYLLLCASLPPPFLCNYVLLLSREDSNTLQSRVENLSTFNRGWWWWGECSLNFLSGFCLCFPLHTPFSISPSLKRVSPRLLVEERRWRRF